MTLLSEAYEMAELLQTFDRPISSEDKECKGEYRHQIQKYENRDAFEGTNFTSKHNKEGATDDMMVYPEDMQKFRKVNYLQWAMNYRHYNEEDIAGIFKNKQPPNRSI